jgi:hypothetical protein
LINLVAVITFLLPAFKIPLGESFRFSCFTSGRSDEREGKRRSGYSECYSLERRKEENVDSAFPHQGDLLKVS